LPVIQAVVLDMDGLLIDTEPTWHTAEKQVFAKLGIDLTDAAASAWPSPPPRRSA
jgi:beta-phosphoglucomutase-like phosphatase (HAD superfamily)